MNGEPGKRHALELIAAILKAVEQPVIKTRIMQAANMMNGQTLDKYLRPLIIKGYIDQTQDFHYVSTNGGKELLQEIDSVLAKIAELRQDVITLPPAGKSLPSHSAS